MFDLQIVLPSKLWFKMKFWKLYVISIFIFYIPQVVYSREKTLQRGTTNRFRFAIFKDNLFYALDGTIIETGYAETKQHCLLKCVKNQECFSINIGVKPGPDGKVLCELLSSDKYSWPGSFQQSLVFHHYSIPSPCESFPCQHGGTCLALYEMNDYTCNCTEDYTGNNCEEFLSCGVDRDWKFFESSCYKYFSEQLSWVDASSSCKELNGSLGIFHTAEEYAFVTTEVFPADKRRSWIGLNDLDSSRYWKWVDGSGLSFSQWIPGEPNNVRENCVEVMNGFFWGMQLKDAWNDNACTTSLSFICEKSARLEPDP